MDGWEEGLAEGLDKVALLIERVASGLCSWSTNVLGDWEKRRKQIKRELDKCRRASLSTEGVRKTSGGTSSLSTKI